MLRRLLFFFQAEDGIRDLTVTGVQTCALPIYAPAAIRVGARFRVRLGRPSRFAIVAVDRGVTGEDRERTPLDSSHSQNSYAVFFLKKKKNDHPLCPRHGPVRVGLHGDAAAARP